MSVSAQRTTACEGCGVAKAAKLEYWAYRSIYSQRGPWLIERLCIKCREALLNEEHWNVRICYRVRQFSLPGLRKARA